MSTHREAYSEIDGSFIFVNVPAGVYSVRALFDTAKITITNVIVSDGQTSEVNFEFDRAALFNNNIVIPSNQKTLQAGSPGSQTVISSAQLNETPGTRTIQDYLNTQTGITDSSYLRIREGRPFETSVLINGLNFRDIRTGRAKIFIPTSAVEQIAFRTSGSDAEFGSSGSGIVRVEAKSGSSDAYHGSFSFSKSPAHVKRFGPSMYDPQNNFLRAHLDPDVAFIGTNEALNKGIIFRYEWQQLLTYFSFSGFISAANNLPTVWRANLKQGQTITPVHLYLFDAWMHMVNPDFDKLNSVIRSLSAQGKNVGSEVTDQNLINLFRDHANKEGKYPDFNFDGGFGGPVPLIGKSLGDATFYLSNITNRTSYIQPMELDYNLSSSTMLTMKSDITNSIVLKFTGIWEYQKGMNPAKGNASEPVNLYSADDFTGTGKGLDAGVMVPEDNIKYFTNTSTSAIPYSYWWNPTYLQPWIENTYLAGINLTKTISNKTFYEITGSYQYTTENIDPANSAARNNNPIGYIGPIPITEVPYGRAILNPGQSTVDIAGWSFDTYYTIPGLSDRFGGGGVFYDNSSTKQLNLKFNLGSQISKSHFIKAGIEYSYVNLNSKRWSYVPAQSIISTTAFDYGCDVSSFVFSAYARDEITIGEMTVNLGVRIDSYSFGDTKWPTGNFWDASAFGSSLWMTTDFIQQLQSGRSLIWERWNMLNDQYLAANQKPLLEKVESHLTVSPGIGFSYTLSDRMRFYFNYNYNRSMPPIGEMFTCVYKYNNMTGGIAELGNPNLQPAKTIQYEFGVNYNLADQYLIRAALYTKEIKGEPRTLSYIPTAAGLPSYYYRSGDSFRNISGLEIQITKNLNDFITGWLNFQYVYVSEGLTGKRAVYQDYSSNYSQASYYYNNVAHPDPVPRIKANIIFNSPAYWGNLFGGWQLSIMPDLEIGSIFKFNPRAVQDAVNEFRWPGFFQLNLKLSKVFNTGVFKVTAFLDVRNLFNSKAFLYKYAFENGTGGTAYGIDFQNYMASLHLKEYSDTYWNAVRNETQGLYLYPGYTYSKDVVDAWGNSHKKGDVVDEDHIGDLRSKDKPYINDPNFDIFTLGNTRTVWFGIQFDF